MTETVDAALSVINGAAAAMAVVEAVDEAWLYRHAAQSRADVSDTSTQSVMCHSGDGPELLVYDRAEPAAWIQSDDFRAVGR